MLKKISKLIYFIEVFYDLLNDWSVCFFKYASDLFDVFICYHKNCIIFINQCEKFDNEVKSYDNKKLHEWLNEM